MAEVNPRFRYHCVTVESDGTACSAALALKNARLLSAEAPRLPLAACDRPADCQCRFRHHDDRRMGPRRAREQGQLADPWVNTERRKRYGRRATDLT